MEIKIDVTDCLEETQQKEMEIVSIEDVIELLKSGERTSTVTKAVIINRELEKAESDIMSPNKFLLLSGGMKNISKIVRDRRRSMRVGDETYQVPEMVGDNSSPKEEVSSYVETPSQESTDRASKYLINVVPGHIWNRLLIIFETEGFGGVRLAATNLKITVDEMVEKLRRTEHPNEKIKSPLAKPLSVTIEENKPGV